MLQYFLIREDALENSYRNCCHFKDFLTCNFKQWNFISVTASSRWEPENECRILQQPNLILDTPVNL